MKAYYIGFKLKTRKDHGGEVYALPLFALTKDDKSEDDVARAVEELKRCTSEEISGIRVCTPIKLVTEDSIASVKEEISTLTGRYATALLKLNQFVDENLQSNDDNLLTVIRAKLDISEHTLYLLDGQDDTKVQGERFTITLNQHFQGIVFVGVRKPKRGNS
jgi:hypothetical protein